MLLCHQLNVRNLSQRVHSLHVLFVKLGGGTFLCSAAMSNCKLLPSMEST